MNGRYRKIRPALIALCADENDVVDLCQMV